MEIIQNSVLGIRSARMTFETAGKPVFTLFPMIHIADPDFFRRVRADAAAHDLILREGVPTPWWLPVRRAYGVLAGGGDGLASQADLLPEQVSRAPHPNVIRADMDGPSFRAGLAALPLWFRALLVLAVPVLMILGRIRGMRDLLLRDFTGTSDERSGGAEDAPSDSPDAVDQFVDLILNRRDQVLLRHVDRAIAKGDAATIAVVFGAGHMPAVIRHLRNSHGYRCTRSVWMEAVSDEPEPQRPPISAPRSAGSTVRM